MPFERMVNLAKLRWRIERDYLEFKPEPSRKYCRDVHAVASIKLHND